MLPSVRDDFTWSRRYIPALKRIMGEYLIGEAPFEEDAHRATDLIVLRLDAVRVACRVRRHKYLDRYPDEFTIRCDRPSGAKTELRKIVSGFGDYLIYGFAGPVGTELCAWTLGDLSVFREWFTSEAIERGRQPGRKQPNDDGTHFRAFDLAEMPHDFVVARQCARAEAA